MLLMLVIVYGYLLPSGGSVKDHALTRQDYQQIASLATKQFASLVHLLHAIIHVRRV